MMVNLSPSLSPLQVTILIDGQSYPGLNATLVSVLVEETIEGLFRCEARFMNWGSSGGTVDYLYFDRTIIDFGRELAVSVGDGEAFSRVIFEGRIMGVEGDFPQDAAPQIVVLAADRMEELRMTQRSRVFENVTEDQVIALIAQEHQLLFQNNVSTQTQHAIFVQANQSDLTFIRERARDMDASVWVSGDTLLLIAHPGPEGGPLELQLGRALRQFRVRADLAEQCTELRVTGWNDADKQAIEASAGAAAIHDELDSGLSGSTLLADFVGEHTAWVVHRSPLSFEEAHHIATARYRERARRFIMGTGTADGDPRIIVGAPLNLQGLGGLFNGVYHVTRVRHTFDQNRGYVTEFDVEKPGLGRPYRSPDHTKDTVAQPDRPGKDAPPDNAEKRTPTLGVVEGIQIRTGVTKGEK